MPGLVGAISLNSDKIDRNLMRAMRDALKHRDWYKLDDYIDPGETIAISRVHLNIINQKEQPYLGADGNVKIFLHGEIYNDEALKADPLEFIYQLYQKQGINFASFLKGSFIVVIIDENVVYIANDRIASKPLFFFSNGQTVYFGPEMKSLLGLPSLKRELNLAAVADFLANGQFIREHTFIEGVETVDYATVLKIAEGMVTKHKYWEYDLEQEGQDHGWNYYQQILASLLRQAVSRRLRDNSTYGMLLSGGYDSRGILGCYLEEKKNQPLYTISWGREENIPNSDCVIAKKLAEELGADHRFYQLNAAEVINNFRNFIWLGEGLTWFPESYNIFNRIRDDRGIKILLRGDECFGWTGLLVHDEYTMFRTLSLNALEKIGRYQRVLKPTYYKLFSELDATTSRHVSAKCPAKNIHNRKDYFYLTVRLKYFINPLNYVKNFAMESFTPFLDYDLLDFVSNLPVKYRLDKCLYRKTVMEIFPELFREVAKERNDIDWAASFKKSPELKHFIYEQLIEEPSILSEFINTNGLKQELHTFFATPLSATAIRQPGLKAKVKRSAYNIIEASPDFYNLAHKVSYNVEKWRRQSKDILPTEQLIIRLLILKVWGDVFLNQPIARTSSL